MGLLGTLGSLNVLLSADTAQFSSAMDKAAYAAEKNFGKISFSAKATLTLVATALIANTTKALTFADSIADMADRIGITSKQMSVLAYAAKMSDVDVSSLEATIRKMSVSAYSGSSAFTTLGVKVKDSSGRLRSAYDIFIDTAEAFNNMPDGVGKSAAAVAIFGKSGADIVPLLNSGKDGIADFAKEAKNLGVVIEEETARNADRFDKWFKTVTERMKGVGITTIDFLSKVNTFFAGAYMSTSDYIDLQLKLSEESKKAAEGEKSRTQILAEQAIAFEKSSAAAERKKKLDEAGSKLIDDVRTAQEKYNDELSKYGELLAAGSISESTFERAVKKANDTLAEGNQKTNKFKDAAKDLGFTFQSVFEDAILEGKKFSEVLTSLLQDIERIILRTMVTGPLANSLSTFLSGIGGSTAITGGVGGTTTQTTQFGTTWSPSAHGNIFSGGNLIPFKNGGLISRPTLFPMANGGTGLAGEAGTEAIMPLFRTGSGDLGVKSGGGGVEVNIYAPEGSKVSQSSQKVGDKEQINIMIDEAVAGSVKNSGSKTYKALKNTFGLRQSLNTR